jgi:flagellar protein FliO/FliZ
MNSGLTSLLSFIAVLAMIPVVLWLLKRTPMGGSAAHGVMRTVAVLPISPSQKLLTVEVGQGEDRRWLVLGVTGQQITTLHTMPPQADVPVAGTPSLANTPFAQALARLRKGGTQESGHAQ